MHTQFNEEEQEKKIAELRDSEEENLAEILSKKYSISYIDLSVVSIDTDALGLIPEKEARENEVAAFDLVGKKIKLAVRSPGKGSTKKIVSDLEKKGYKVRIFIVSLKSLEKAWGRYADVIFATESSAGLLDISDSEIEKFVSENKTPDEVRGMLDAVIKTDKSHRVTRIVETFVASGISLGASDIHIEPQENIVNLRLRLDGILIPFVKFDRETYKLLLSRVKLLSGLKLSVTKNAQDGRFSIHVGKIEIEIRTSILPGNYGESIVLRILNPDTIALDLEDLGMRPEILSLVKKELDKPNGMILNTGPTGSGKTTALYAFLKYVYSPGIKIITIEDPVEYHLPGVTQTQVNKAKGYTFIEGLRSALRQDPDVIMVGEIRDQETAEVAVNAALTGHLVLSTLHTNNAAGAFPRLIDLGINPHTLGSALHLVIAQRLVRKLRPECKKSIEYIGKTKTVVKGFFDSLVEKSVNVEGTNPNSAWEVNDECKKRDDGGYKGRIGIFEGIKVDGEMEEFIKDSPGEREVINFAKKQKIMTIEEDGILKILEGVTDIEELKRVVDIGI